MCDKAVNTYPSTTEYVPDPFKTQETCDKVVDKSPFVFDSIPNQNKTQEMCNEIVSGDTIKNCHDRYEAREICNKAVGE